MAPKNPRRILKVIAAKNPRGILKVMSMNKTTMIEDALQPKRQMKPPWVDTVMHKENIPVKQEGKLNCPREQGEEYKNTTTQELEVVLGSDHTPPAQTCLAPLSPQHPDNYDSCASPPAQTCLAPMSPQHPDNYDSCASPPAQTCLALLSPQHPDNYDSCASPPAQTCLAPLSPQHPDNYDSCASPPAQTCLAPLSPQHPDNYNSYASPDPDQVEPCLNCQSASHCCMECGLVRCTHYHLKSMVEGKLWVCSSCDQTAVGILGQSLQRPPTKSELEGGIKRATKRHRDKAFDASPPGAALVHPPDLAFDEVLASQAPLLSNSNQIDEQIPCTTESPAKVVRLESYTQQASQSLPSTPAKESSAHKTQSNQTQEWQPGPGDVTFCMWTGRVQDHVVWVGKPGGETEWDANAQTIYIQPSTMLQGNPNTIMFRIMEGTTIGYIMMYVLKLWYKQGFPVVDPFMSFKGVELENTRSTNEFMGHNDTLLLESRQGDRYPVVHMGKLWCCTECGHSNTRFSNIKEDHSSVHPMGIQMLNRVGLPIQAWCWGGHKRIRDGKVRFAPDLSTMFTFGRLPPPPIPVETPRNVETPDHLLRDLLVMYKDKEYSGNNQPLEYPKPGPSVMVQKKPASQVSQVAPTMASMVDRDRPSKRNKAVYQKDYSNCEMADIENSSDEWSGSDEDESEEINVVTPEGKQTRPQGKMNELDRFLAKHCVDSDEEEDDESILYQLRKERQAVRRQDMLQVMEEGLDTSKLYKMKTAKDKELMLELKGFINSKTHKLTDMRHVITEQAADDLEAGQDLEGLDRAAQAGTSKEYWYGLNRLLGLIQGNKNTYSGGELEDGKIRLQQYFMFNNKEHLRYDNPITIIEQGEGNMSMRVLMLGGWLMLGKLLVDKLEDAEYKAMFIDLSILDPMDRTKAAEDRAEQEQTRIMGKMAVMKNSEKFTEWKSRRKSGAAKAKLYRDDWQMQTELTPVQVLHRFYKSQELADLVNKMVTKADWLAMSKDIKIEDSFIAEMNELIPILPFLVAGYRPDLLANLNRGQFATAVPDIANPHKPLNLDPNLKNNPQIMANIAPDGIYVNPEPMQTDRNDPNPPQQDPLWDQGLLQGFIINPDLHKTGHKWLQFIFLTKSTHFLVQIYMDITKKILSDKGINVNHKTCVFVNRLGKALMDGKRSLSFKKFMEITGTTHWNIYSFRILMANTLHSTNDLSIIELQPFAQGHSMETAVDSYVTRQVKMIKSKMAHTKYRELIGMQEKVVREKELTVVARSRAQKEGTDRDRVNVMLDKRKDLLDWRKKVDASKVPSEKRMVTDNQKLSLLELVDSCDSSHRHMEPLSMDLLEDFLGDKANKHKDIKIHKVLLNMIDVCPLESMQRRDLQNHLLLTVRFRAEKVDKSNLYMAIKRLELMWSWSLLQTLEYMRRSRSSMALVNQNISSVLENIALRKDSFKYCMGSEAIKRQVETILKNMEKVARPKTVGKQVRHREFLESIDEENHQDPKQVLHVSEEPQQVFVFDQDKIIETEDGQSLIVKGGTPVKVKAFKSSGWTDPMKIQLLRLYILYAEDPLIRDGGGMSRANARNQLRPIWSKESIFVEGEEVKLAGFDLSHMALIMAQKGLKEQRGKAGLYRLIDQHMGMLEENPTTELVRQHVEGIIKIAQDLSFE